ncbi:nitroreductase family protein [Niallia sp. 01092]|uniref:nitroreductase family protein n=1 Tax=unclassified Niallia TaxID=2837522 RepID=UPI003FD2F747
MTNFETIIKNRRSANNFVENVSISKQELNEIFEEVKLAPSAFNLQHAQYIVIQDHALKEQLREAAYGQYKIKTSSAVIIVLGDKQAYQNVAKIYEGLNMLGILNDIQYEAMVQEVIQLHENRGIVFQRDEAIRNASLSAMLFMLAAKNKGWDTCPMIGFDQEKVRELLKIDDNLEPVLMITIGKEKVESRKPRGYRKPVGEFVTFL